MAYFRCFGIMVFFCFELLFLNLPFSAGQGVSATREEGEIGEPDSQNPIEPFKISVNVNEVRLDVVVLDKKGNQITDLTAADFEVRQDKLPQDVTSSVYIRNQAAAAASPSISQKGAQNLPKPSEPASSLKEEEVRRTIVFVVDNLAMQPKHLFFAKLSMKNFLEKQMQPGDIVSIIRTGAGNSALQMFLSDKRQLMARIESIPAEGPAFRDGQKEPDDWQYHRIYDNQLSTLSYSIRAMKDMPGDDIQTLAIIYNADMEAIARSEIETQTILYKDGKELIRGRLKPINPADVKDPDSIPILRRLTLGADMTPGDYAIQLLVIDKKKGKNKGVVASQTLNFKVVEKQ